MQSRPSQPSPFVSRPEGSNTGVTAAVGMEETVGHQRARRKSLFAHTVIWITGLICAAFLLATFVQAWSNNALIQQLQSAQQSLHQTKVHHEQLKQDEQYYQDPSVIESEARQQLGFVRPGEQSVVIVKGSDPTQPKPGAQKPDKANDGYWQEWLQVLFGNK